MMMKPYLYIFDRLFSFSSRFVLQYTESHSTEVHKSKVYN